MLWLAEGIFNVKRAARPEPQDGTVSALVKQFARRERSRLDAGHSEGPLCASGLASSIPSQPATEFLLCFQALQRRAVELSLDVSGAAGAYPTKSKSTRSPSRHGPTSRPPKKWC